jgi:hypothetical protein
VQEMALSDDERSAIADELAHVEELVLGGMGEIDN